MIVRRLVLRDFRRFAHFAADFAPGLNVVLGNNEEGKSTLREALTLALFQSPNTSDKKVLALRRWGAAEQFALELTFAAEGETYHLAKDFQARTATLTAAGSGERLQDAKAIQRRLADLLGLGSRAVFESTVRVSQRDIARLTEEKEVADGLQRVVTGGEEDVRVSQVLAELDRALGQLRRNSRANPGPLVALPEAIARREEALAQKRRTFARAGEARGQLAAQETALAAAREDLATKEALLQGCAKRLQLEDELAAAEREEAALDARLAQVEELDRTIARLEAELPAYAPVLALSAERMAEMLALAGQAAGVGTEKASPNVPGKGPRPLRTAWVVAGAVLVLLGLAGALAQPALLLLALVGAGLLLWEWQRSRGDGDARAEVARLRAEERAREATLAVQKLAAMLAEVGCTSAAEVQARRRAGEDLDRRLRESKARREGLLAGESAAELAERRRAVSKRIRDIKEEMAEPALRLAAVDQAGYQRLQRGVASLRDEVAALEASLADLRVEARVNRVALDEVHALEEELAALRERLAAATERQQVLSLAREVVVQAWESTMVTAQEVLAEELGRYVAEITAGRYSRALVEPTKLEIHLMAPERPDPVRVAVDGELSTGTVEQVYLAARLALAKLLAQGRRPPLILDDPFVTFDGPRTAAVLALCRRLAAEQQILLFTCDESYAPHADHLIRLPAVGLPGGMVCTPEAAEGAKTI
ncbi:MAG: AAA family ATPase [Dehalococcoidales bacterium]|nr:AAA family ATPase [Dehalococcoidales bacterium]